MNNSIVYEDDNARNDVPVDDVLGFPVVFKWM